MTFGSVNTDALDCNKCESLYEEVKPRSLTGFQKPKDFKVHADLVNQKGKM